MKWYHFIYPAFVMVIFFMHGSYEALIALLIFPWFGLIPIIDAFLGPDPEFNDERHSAERLFNKSAREREAIETSRQKFHRKIVGMCWLVAIIIIVQMS